MANKKSVEGGAKKFVQAGQLRVLFNSNVQSISDNDVAIEVGGSIESITNDAVVISAGGILPSAFLRTVGIQVETKWGTE